MRVAPRVSFTPSHATRTLPARSLRLPCRAAAVDRTAELRRLLAQPSILRGPCCHDAMSAKLIEQAEFEFGFMSGFCTAASRIGAPDTGLISYGEMVDVGRLCNQATSRLPLIGDGDTGYGNAMNVARTVRGYADAGFAGILIEDQVAPKSCGHVRGKRVCSREEAVTRIRAAVRAREEHRDICIVARTDARQALSLDEALWRVQAFADAGADIVFIDALESRAEMEALCRLGGAVRGLPKMANNLEGGGKTPCLRPEELEAMGFKMVAYPLTLLGVSVKAMQDALGSLKRGEIPGPDALPAFRDLQRTIGFDDYFRASDEFALSMEGTLPMLPGYEVIIRKKSDQPPNMVEETAATAAAAAIAAAAAATQAASVASAVAESAGREAVGAVTQAAAVAEAAAQASVQAAADVIDAVGGAVGDMMQERGSAGRPDVLPSEALRTARPPPRNKFWREEIGPTKRSSEPAAKSEPDVVVIEADSSQETQPEGGRDWNSAVSVEVLSSRDDDPFARDRGSRGASSGASKSIRIKVTSAATGETKLETRIPAGFLEGIASFVPEVRGVDLEALVSQATGQTGRDVTKPIFDFPVENDRVQIWLE